MTYSLLERVKDGPFTLPRWGHHLLKSATHGVASVGVWLLIHNAVAATIFGGPLFWLGLAIREHYYPSDPQPLTRWQHFADWATDGALSCVPLSLALLATSHQSASTVLTGCCICVYVSCHPDARP